MRVAGIIYLVYEAPQDFPVCVYSQWQRCFVRHQGAEQILSACVPKRPFAPECSPWGGDLPRALLESYN